MKRLLPALAFAVLPAAEAAALTLTFGNRSVEAIFADQAGNELSRDFDDETVTNDAVYTRPLSAFIGGSGFEASIGMGVTGFFGIEAHQFRAGALTTRVTQFESYLNDTVFPVELSASFVVVEGALRLVAGTGSTLSLDVVTGDFTLETFIGSGVLTATDFTSTYAESDEPLNGVQGVDGVVRLPFQRVTIDLGVLGPGETFDYIYSLSIVADSPLMEFARWTFVDPGAVEGLASPFQLTGTPVGVTAPVPLPAPALLLVSALALLAARARRGAA